MSRGINKAILVGNLGRDPETRYMPNGKAVTNFSIATSESWKDAKGDKQERTEWHNLVAFERLAEIAAQYLRKGSQVYVEGKLQTRKWQDKDGKDRYSTEIVIRELQMLGGKRESDAPQKQGDGKSFNWGEAEQRTAAQNATEARETVTADFDDDIPF